MGSDTTIGPGRACHHCGEVYGMHTHDCPMHVDLCRHQKLPATCIECRIDRLEKRVSAIENK